MNSDLAIDEARAAAQPRDWPVDFDKPTTWNVCSDCVRTFLGAVSRTRCALCAPKETS